MQVIYWKKTIFVRLQTLNLIMIQNINNWLSEIKAEQLFWALLWVWIALDVYQAIGMEVMLDEAYYAMYAKKLAWGYYDHPPMVALSIFLSDCLFSGNLGVRFVNVLTHAATVWLIWKMLPGRKEVSQVLLYFAIAASLTMFSVYGFVTTPDGLLLFFAALFLLSYKRFLQEESWGNTLMLTVATAGMFYSKYHAVLVIGFVVLSNLRLLLNPKFRFCLYATAVLFIPHLYWQFENHFPSLQYHLVARNQGIRPEYVFKYFPEQFAVFSPIALGGALYILFKRKAENLFDRALHFLIAGVFIFFQIMTFKGRVEAHWPIVVAIPMIVLLYKWSLRDNKFRKIQLKGALCMLPLILIARFILTTSLLPEYFQFHSKEQIFRHLEKQAGKLPVVFPNTGFQEASAYQYFTEKEAFPLSSPFTRSTQFDIWGPDKPYQDSTVFIADWAEGGGFKGFVVNRLQTTNQIRIIYSGVPDQARVGDTLRIRYKLSNPYRDIDMNHPELPVTFCSVHTRPSGIVATSPAKSTPDFQIIKAGETLEGELTTVVPDIEPDHYLFELALMNRLCIPYNSAYVRIKILKNNG